MRPGACAMSFLPVWLLFFACMFRAAAYTQKCGTPRIDSEAITREGWVYGMGFRSKGFRSQFWASGGVFVLVCGGAVCSGFGVGYLSMHWHVEAEGPQVVQGAPMHVDVCASGGIVVMPTDESDLMAVDAPVVLLWLVEDRKPSGPEACEIGTRLVDMGQGCLPIWLMDVTASCAVYPEVMRGKVEAFLDSVTGQDIPDRLGDGDGIGIGL